MARGLKKRPPPFCVRLSDAQRTELTSLAARAELSLGGYFKAAVFGEPPSRQSRRPSEDKRELSKLIPEIGKIGANVKQLAYQATAGSWPGDRALADAYTDILWMRDAIMRTLGITPPPQSDGAAVSGKPPPRQSRHPAVNKVELANLIAAIAVIGPTLNRLAHQANAGSWPGDRAIADACADIRWMRHAVMRVLGITPQPVPDDPAVPPAGP